MTGTPTAQLPQEPKTKAEPKELELGQAAPLLRLNDHRGHAVLVGGQRSHWTVLAFFPKAATPG